MPPAERAPPDRYPAAIYSFEGAGVGAEIVGVCAVIGGVLITSQNDAHSPNLGTPFFLPSFASVFLGSAILRPGKFNVLGLYTKLGLSP